MSERPKWQRLPRIGGGDVDAEVRTELETHLALQIADLVAEGWTEEAARAEAARRLGRRGDIEYELVTIGRERERAERRAVWCEAAVQDARYAVRLLRRSPGFAVIVVATLALGIGANTAVFSAVDAALFRPLPYGGSDDLVSVWTRSLPESGNDYQWRSSSVPELRDYAAAAHAVSGVAAYTTGRVNLAGGDAVPDRVPVGNTAANLFDVLDVQPALGRTFAPGEDAVGAACVVVLSHGLWLEQFAASTEALGRTILLDGAACEVIGVTPSGFFFPNENVRLWRPLALDANPALAQGRRSHWVAAVARLAPGNTLAHAEAELEPMMAAWREADEHHRGHFIVLRPFREELVGDQRAVLVILLAAVGLVLLIICANLANLLLTRAEGRRREMAIRAALGAGRGRIARQLLTESMLLAGLGGALGLAVAHALVRILGAVAQDALPRAAAFALDARVLAFTLAVTLFTGLLFGLLPAFHARTRRLQEILRAEGRSLTMHGHTARLRRALVVIEVALSVAVVSAAALLARSYDELRGVDPGMTTADVVVLDVTLPAAAYQETATIAAFMEGVRTDAAKLPGVQSVGLVSDLPLRSVPGMDSFRIDGRAEPHPGEPSTHGGYVMATPGYFDAAGIPLLSGRGIEERDVRGAPFVVVIDELAARRYWPDRDPIGQRIQHYDADVPWLTIVGVVGSVRYESPRLDVRPAIYVPHAQAPRGGAFYTGRAMTLVVRASHPRPELLAPSVREIVARRDPQVPVTNVALLDDVIDRALGTPRLATGLMSLFALASLVVGALGVYGVLSYLVRARTQEIGIRVALGATSASVYRLILGQGMTLTVVGTLLGIGMALASGSLLTGMLFGVRPNDPVTLIAVAAVLAVVSFAASYLPARRATRVDPVAAIRNG